MPVSRAAIDRLTALPQPVERVGFLPPMNHQNPRESTAMSRSSMPPSTPGGNTKTATMTVPAVSQPAASPAVPEEPKRDYLSDPSVQKLIKMLRYRRPKGGITEQKFIKEFLDKLPNMFQDQCGNIYCLVGRQDPLVLWSCHTDSVHRQEGEQGIVVDGEWIRLPKKTKSNCLGADDCAGIWIMTEMIHHKVEGLYVFHFGEESGGIGSNYIADKYPEFLRGIQMAIAFDRRGKEDVITHQGGTRCCSDNFAKSLAAQLPGKYSPCSGGVFTDTANYTRLISECTNLSVGYESEHGINERLHIPHIVALRDAMLQIDVEKLVIERDPSKVEYKYAGHAHWGGNYEGGRRVYRGKYGGNYTHSPSNTAGASNPPVAVSVAPRGTTTAANGNASVTSGTKHGNAGSDIVEPRDFTDWNPNDRRPTSWRELLTDYPDEVGDILEQLGMSVDDLYSEIEAATTPVRVNDLFPSNEIAKDLDEVKRNLDKIAESTEALKLTAQQAAAIDAQSEHEAGQADPASDLVGGDQPGESVENPPAPPVTEAPEHPEGNGESPAEIVE
jgi:ribosome-binding protein aMBF1 (putative translation factor)